MKYNRILLIFPKYKHTQFGATHQPVGLGHLSEILKVNGIENDVVDMRLDPNVCRLKSKIKEFQPDLIGISVMTLLHRQTYRLIEEIKKTFLQGALVVGGPHVATFRENTLHQCQAINFAITQEGQYALVELCQGLNYANIKGFIYRRDEQVIYTGERPFVTNLDSLFFPKYSKFALDKYITDEISILTSRGCQYKCIYCPIKTTIGRMYPKNFMKQIMFKMMNIAGTIRHP